VRSYFHVHVSFGDLEALITGTYETDRNLPVKLEVWRMVVEGRTFKSEDYERSSYRSLFNRLAPELEKRLALPRGSVPVFFYTYQE
jgi:hypothetical protein